MVASGSAKYIQSCLRLSSRRGHASGMWIQGSRSQPARFEEQDLGVLVLGQPVRQRAAGRAGADDDDVVASPGHYATLSGLCCAIKQPAEPFAGLARHLCARRIAGRKLVAPMVWLASIYDGDGMGHVAGGAALGRQAGVGGRIPGAFDELDRFLGVGAGEHRPQQVLEIGDVDILIDHDDVFRRVGGGAALRGDVAGLHRMTGIFLPDRDTVQHARAADLVAPHLLPPPAPPRWSCSA